MPIPIHVVGLALAGKTLLSNKKNSRTSLTRKRRISRPRPQPRLMRRQRPSGPNLLQKLMSNISSSITKITQKPTKENYQSIVQGFLPENAKLLTPKYPLGASQIQFADLDGDSQNEMIASYALNNETTTLILKKQNESWNELTRITNNDSNTMHYIGFADIMNEGKKQLLLSSTKSKASPILEIYSLDNAAANKMIDLNYSRFEVLDQSQNGEIRPARLAVWNEAETGEYDIKVLHWNGEELAPAAVPADYYHRNVIPYFAQKAKQTPGNLNHWYNLTKSLINAGAYRDASAAIELGLYINQNSPSKEKLASLKEEIENK
ncbi:hypothetical protein [Petroclostridium sp. X23]|uniref:hypothetical protein n=1 Tax=Petroclostridium sp. X23 TaxID=3045146 RepID=UPI0024ADF149|nr:hypothetical protein [Petroclostridium sp. X23]WHH57894.1 hypothetical protein QKW49_19075 [Petroclostridium sp. X23]